jgi:hypothetical protein
LRLAEKKSGGPCEAARSNSIGSDRANSSISDATSSPRYVVTFAPAPGVDPIRNLRLLLKRAKRAFGLIAVDAFEDHSSPLPLSNKAADEFRELRNEVVAARARTWRRP